MRSKLLLGSHMLNRTAFIGIAIVTLALLGCDSGSERPRSNWPKLGISLDKIGLKKTQVADCCFRGFVRSIQTGNFDADSGSEIAVVAQTGVHLFNYSTLKQKAKIEYKKPDGKPLWFGLTPYLISNEDNFSIAMRGGGFGEVGLLDYKGKEIWMFKPGLFSSPQGMEVDDSKLGSPWFYVLANNKLYKLNKNGEVIWKRHESASYIALIKGRNNKTSIATADYGSKIIHIWSANGELTLKFTLPFKQDGFDVVHSGEISGFVIKSGNKIAFIDHNGRHRFTHSYQGVPIYHGPSAALVRFTANQPPVLAIRSTSRSATGKSVLSIFSIDGEHLYEEYMDGGPALGVVHVNNERRDRLFIGEGTRKLWGYEKK